MMSTWKANLSAVKIPFTLIVYQHIDANFLRLLTMYTIWPLHCLPCAGKLTYACTSIVAAAGD